MTDSDHMYRASRAVMWRHLEYAHGLLFTTHDAKTTTLAQLRRLHDVHHSLAVKT